MDYNRVSAEPTTQPNRRQGRVLKTATALALVGGLASSALRADAQAQRENIQTNLIDIGHPTEDNPNPKPPCVEDGRARWGIPVTNRHNGKVSISVYRTATDDKITPSKIIEANSQDATYASVDHRDVTVISEAVEPTADGKVLTDADRVIAGVCDISESTTTTAAPNTTTSTSTTVQTTTTQVPITTTTTLGGDAPQPKHGAAAPREFGIVEAPNTINLPELARGLSETKPAQPAINTAKVVGNLTLTG